MDVLLELYFKLVVNPFRCCADRILPSQTISSVPLTHLAERIWFEMSASLNLCIRCALLVHRLTTGIVRSICAT